MAGDPYWDNVALLMHMNDTALSDVRGHKVTLNGTAARSAVQSKAGGYSALFAASGGDLTVNYSAYVATGDSIAPTIGSSTYELWVYPNDTTALRGLIKQGYFVIRLNAGGYPSATLAGYTAGSDVTLTSAAAIATGQWHHLALVKRGSVVTLFVNGVVAATSTFSGVLGVEYNLIIGSMGGQTNGAHAYIDEVRLTSGIARYTADFSSSLPSAPFPDGPCMLSGTTKDTSGSFAQKLVYGYRHSDGALSGKALSAPTTGVFSIPALDSSPHFAVCTYSTGDPYWPQVGLLLHMDDTGLTDAKGHVVTINGTAARSAAHSKAGGYSGLFASSGGTVAIDSDTNINLITGDLTIEYWIYPTNLPSNSLHVYQGVATNSLAGITIGHASGVPYFYFGNSSASAWEVAINSSVSITAGAWHHIAVCRERDIFTAYVNGAVAGRASYDGELGYTYNPLYVGGNSDLSIGASAHIDEFRITKACRYFADFSASLPAAPFLEAPTTPASNALIYDNIPPV